jgi:hypothetical protein
VGIEGERRIPINSPQTGDPLVFLDLDKSFQKGGPEMLLQLKAQLVFVESDTLPVDMDEQSLMAMDAAGVRFEEMIPDDAQFAFATLPEGWTRKRTKDRLRSELLDEKGRVRAVITYIESFSQHLRHASLTALPRYSYEIDEEFLKRTDMVVAVIKNAGTFMWKTEPIPVTQTDSREQAYKKAKKVLDDTFPGWQNPAAYWNGEQR